MFRSIIVSVSLGVVLMAPAQAQEAQALHDRIITFDAEMDIPFEFMNEANDVGRETDMQVDLPKMDRGGLDGALFVNWVLQGERTPTAYAKARVKRNRCEIKQHALQEYFQINA